MLTGLLLFIKLLIMKTIVSIAAGIILTFSAMGQTPEQKKKEEMKDLKKDVVEKREDQKQVTKDLTHAKVKKAVNDHKEVHADRQDMKADEARLKSEGVKHPKYKARHKIKAEKHEQKAKI
jgi:hypothetical protein